MAGVIFTNGDEPYVKLRKGEAWGRKRAVGGWRRDGDGAKAEG